MSVRRTKFVCGNWKMYKSPEEARTLAGKIAANWDKAWDDVEAAICPPFPSLLAVLDLITGTQIQLGAQNCYFENEGAFTGEVSPRMLAELGCNYVILGHSERRAIFGETSVIVAKKIAAAMDVGLRPILCIGESLEEHEAGSTEHVLSEQLRSSLSGIVDLERITIAYEPVWAIGTGKTATPIEAAAAHKFIRSLIGELYSPNAAESTRILYGGSVKPGNAAELFAQADIDGGLIGGASLKHDDFLAIVAAAA